MSCTWKFLDDTSRKGLERGAESGGKHFSFVPIFFRGMPVQRTEAEQRSCEREGHTRTWQHGMLKGLWVQANL